MGSPEHDRVNRTISSMVEEPEESQIGGPGKCGLLFYKYWFEHKQRDPSTKIPDVQVKFKIYRLSCFDQKEGTFFCDFILMLDWEDQSLSISEKNPPDFHDHFWPKCEVMNMAPGEDDIDFTDEKAVAPKLKKGSNHASMTIHVRRQLCCRLNFHEFPFDRQVLELSIKMLSVQLRGEKKGIRPWVRHPTIRKHHELIPESDWLPEFDFLGLESKCYSSKFGATIEDDQEEEFKEALDEGTYYQDQFTLQIVLARDSKSVLWNLCFSLWVVDVMVFTAHGIPIEALADRLGINLTLLLTAMAFKWVLNDGMPAVPYLTVMECYVILTFSMLFMQGVAFWFLADAFNYRCAADSWNGTESNTEQYKDWVWGDTQVFSSGKNATGGLESSTRWLPFTCLGIHLADRVILFVEVFFWLLKNLWFSVRLCQRGNPCERCGTHCRKRYCCGGCYGACPDGPAKSFDNLCARCFGERYKVSRKPSDGKSDDRREPLCAWCCGKGMEKTGFIDLSQMKEYRADEQEHLGSEEQSKMFSSPESAPDAGNVVATSDYIKEDRNQTA